MPVGFSLRLKQKRHLAAFNRVGFAAHDCVEPGTLAVHLAPLHGQKHFGHALVASITLKRVPTSLFRIGGMFWNSASWTVAAHQQFVLARVSDRSHFPSRPSRCRRDLMIPDCPIYSNLLDRCAHSPVPEHLRRQGWARNCEGGAVLRA